MLSSKLSLFLLFFITLCAAAGTGGGGGRVETEGSSVNTRNGDPNAPNGPNGNRPRRHKPTTTHKKPPKATRKPKEPTKPQKPKGKGSFTEPEVAKTTNVKPKKPQATSAPKDKVVPCRAPYGNDNGCSYCDSKYAVKPSPMDKTPIKPFKNNQFASSEGMKGYTIWFSIPEPKEGCKTLIVAPLGDNKAAFGTSGYTTVVAGAAGCYGSTVQATGYGVSECCGNDECSMFGAGIKAPTLKRSVEAMRLARRNNRRRIDARDAKTESYMEILEEREADADSMTLDDVIAKRTAANLKERSTGQAVERRTTGSPRENVPPALINKRQIDKDESSREMNALWKRFTTFAVPHTFSANKSPPQTPPNDPKAIKCSEAKKIDGGEPYPRLGLQQVNNTNFVCNGLSGQPCRIDLSTTASSSQSNMISNSKTNTETTGGSLAITAGWNNIIGFTGSVTGTVSHDESQAIEQSTSSTSEKGTSQTVSYDMVQAANTIAKVTWVPILACIGYTTTCNDGDHTIEHCVAQTADSGAQMLMYVG